MATIIAVIILVVLAALVLLGASRRRDHRAVGLSREARLRDKTNPALLSEDEEGLTGRKFEEAALETKTEDQVEAIDTTPPEPFVSPDPIAVGVSRRQFFNRGIVGMMGLSIAGFGGASLAFLWPQGVSGFGSKIKVGNIPEILAEIKANNGFLYKPEGRMWLTAFPNGAVEKARNAYSSSCLLYTSPSPRDS